MEEQNLPENRNINTGGGNYNESIEGDYIQATVFHIQGSVVHVYNYPYDTKNNNSSSDNLQCPYRGLLHFTPDDAEYFFGREGFIEELLSATKTRNFIPVLGASGSGKSSVVFAGLLPKLAQQGYWKFTYFRPGSNPFSALEEALLSFSENNEINISKLTKKLEYTHSITDNLSRIKRKYPNDKLLLIVDQFEELFTLCIEEKLRRQFLDFLLTIIRAPRNEFPSVVVVVTMRADFLGYALSYPDFAEQLKADIKLIRSMNRSELSEVIAKPAQMLGVTFQDGLIERILDNVESEPGNLPLLEFALTLLWEKRKRTDKQLTHAAYEAIGEVQGALASHANTIYKNLNVAKQQHLSRIFMQLVHPGEGTEDTRRVATKAEISEENWSLVQDLAHERLVVTSLSADGQETVEVAHEALIRHWQLLKIWIDENRTKIIQKNRIERLAREWDGKQKSPNYLLQGKQLNETLALHKQEYANLKLSDLASKFIKQSIRYRRKNRFKLIVFSLIALIASPAFLGFFAFREIKITQLRNTVDQAKGKNDSPARILALQELVKLGVSLNNIPLTRANLSGANLSDANLSGANLSGANLSGANLKNAILETTNFSDANLESTDLESADLFRANFKNAILKTSKLSYTKLGSAEISGANLESAELYGADLYGASLSGANLQKAVLYDAKLYGAVLNNANLSGANLSGVNLQSANLSGANLSGANLSNSANFHHAVLKNSEFKCVLFDDKNYCTDLRDAKNLQPMQVKTAKNWQLACYSQEFRKELGLPPDNRKECIN